MTAGPTEVIPANPSELRRALTIGRRYQNRLVLIKFPFQVYSNRRSTRLHPHDFDIDVHPDSHLRVEVYSGLPFLKLWRGSCENVEVKFTSSWGNSLEIMPGQGARVEVPWHDTKVTLTGDGNDLLLVAHTKDGHNRVRDFTKREAS